MIPFDEKQFQELRGKQMGMVFQDPMSALNPSMSCGKQVLETLDLHSPHPKKIIKQLCFLFGQGQAS